MPSYLIRPLYCSSKHVHIIQTFGNWETISLTLCHFVGNDPVATGIVRPEKFGDSESMREGKAITERSSWQFRYLNDLCQLIV